MTNTNRLYDTTHLSRADLVVPGADQVVVVLVKTDAWATSTCFLVG